MEFCERCGALLTKRQDDTYACSCGHRQLMKSKKVSERMPAAPVVEVVDRQINPLATYDRVCMRCGYGKAEILTKGTIVTDEDEFFMWRCGKCGYSEKADGLKVT